MYPVSSAEKRHLNFGVVLVDHAVVVVVIVHELISAIANYFDDVFAILAELLLGQLTFWRWWAKSILLPVSAAILNSDDLRWVPCTEKLMSGQ